MLWRYAYDLMGNRILEEKKNPGGKVEESNHYVYNESNQLAEAVLCNGRTKRKVCYTYDGDGNLVKEYSPTDNSLTTYRYTVKDRLEASRWRKVMETWETPDGDFYERHYWTNGVKSYYHD